MGKECTRQCQTNNHRDPGSAPGSSVTQGFQRTNNPFPIRHTVFSRQFDNVRSSGRLLSTCSAITARQLSQLQMNNSIEGRQHMASATVRERRESTTMPLSGLDPKALYGTVMKASASPKGCTRYSDIQPSGYTTSAAPDYEAFSPSLYQRITKSGS